jgi:hypothetical protein
MLIENALADAVRLFHVDALSSAVDLKVDFDMTLLVLESCLYRIRARRMRGYNDVQARQIFRDLRSHRYASQVTVADREVTVRFHRRADLPLVLSSGLFDKPTPWWGGPPLRFVDLCGGGE